MTLPDEFDAAAAKVAGQTSGDPLDRAAAQVVQGQRSAVRTSLYGALLQNPDVAARAQKLGRQTGIPADVVGRNLPEVERNAKLDEFDKVLQNSPALAQWLADQNRAAVSHDDVENLAAIEERVRQFGGMRELDRSILQSITEPVQRGLAQGRRGLTMLFNEMGLFGGLQRQREAARAAAGLGPEGNSQTAVTLANQQREVERFPIPDSIAQGMQAIGGAQTFSDALSAALSNPRAVLETTLQSLGASAPGLVGAMVGSTAGPVGTATGAGLGSFAVEYGNTLQDVLAEKGVNPRDPLAISNALSNPELMAQAREKALKRGLPIAAFDALTAGLAGRLLAGAKPTVASVGGRAAGELALQAGGGAAGEATAQGLTGEFKPGDILMEALAELPTSIVEVPGNYRAAMQSAQRAEQQAQWLAQLDQIAQASKVRERDASTFEQFVEQAAADGPVQDVFINAQTLMQSGMAEQIAAASPSVGAQLQTALVTGGDIRIPVAEYTARIAGTEFNQSLLDHLKTEPGGMSRAEAQEFMQSHSEELQRQVEQVLQAKQNDEVFKASADTVKAAVKSQLDQVGRFTGSVNDAYASMAGNFYAVMGAKLGVSPDALFAKYPLRVQAEGVQGQVLEQGGQISEWADRETAPVGSWVKADYKLADTQPVYQVRELNPSKLYLPELDEQGRLQPEKRKYLEPYTERAKVGEIPPSITVIEMEDGRLRVVDGHRRALAAMAAGKNIRALVSPLVNTPNGPKEATVENIGQFNAPPDISRDILLASVDDSTELPIPETFGGLPTAGMLYHGGRLNFAIDKQTMAVGGKPVMSYSRNPFEALEYAGHARGDVHARPLGNLRIFAGDDTPLTQAARDGDLDAVAAAGYDGVDVRALYGGGYNEVMLWGDASAPTLSAKATDLREGYGLTTPLQPRQQLNQSAKSLPPTIEIDGKQRSTVNSNGQPIAATEEGVRNFWKWFGESKVVDAEGRPLVVYHGTRGDFNEFDPTMADTGAGQSEGATWFASSPDVTERFGDVTMPAYIASPSLLEVTPQNLGEFLPAFGGGMVAVVDGAPVVGDINREATIDGEDVNLIDAVASGRAHPVMQADIRKRAFAAANRAGSESIVFRGFYDASDKPSDIYATFSPTQIKSAIGNSGEFDPANANILMQSGNERDLMVTHNLTAANLLHADKMGGLPVPSLAITKKDTPLTGFGEITLIGPPEMADPKGYASTKVFGADIYSPRYPSVERELDSKAWGAFRKKFEPMAEEMGVSLPDRDDVERRGVEQLDTNIAVMGQFLRDRGIAPEIIMRKGMDDARRARLEEFGLGPWMNNTSSFAMLDDPEFVRLAAEEAASAYRDSGDERMIARADKMVSDPVTSKNLARDLAHRIANDAKLRAKPEADKYETQKALNEQIEAADLSAAFSSFVSDQIDGMTKSERIPQGYTSAGKRKYVPHTLENVVKILKKELRGGESFNYGVGSVRAKFTPQFKSVAQIKKEKGRLISAEQFDAIKGEINAEFVNMAEAMKIRTETLSAIMEDGATQGLARAAKTYDVDLDGGRAEQVAEFMDKLRNLPTAYFEAKILRDVSLSEFKAAVVPEGVDPKALDALRKAGITDIRTYAKGDEADRGAKIGEFQDLFFQTRGGNRGSFSPSTNTITLLKAADLSTFLHESGHFFLEVMVDVASQSDAPTEVQRDMNALLKWFGVSDLNEWHSLDFEEKRHYHEQFARGFEAYLFEGKAPSLELHGLFQRFRAWLVNIYKELKALNVELNDEVRGVFDRMLATSEEIQLAEQGRSMMPLFASPDQAGMTPEEFKAYHDLGVQATADAIEDVQARALRDLAWTRNARGREIKRLQKQAAELRDQVRIEVRREVMSQPVYRAWQFLTGKAEGKTEAQVAHSEALRDWKADRADFETKTREDLRAKLLSDNPEVKGLAKGQLLAKNKRQIDIDTQQAMLEWDRSHPKPEAPAAPSQGFDAGEQTFGRLNTEALKSLGVPEEITKLVQALRMTSPDGLHPDVVAEMFGFSSGDELVRSLAIAEKPAIEIEGLTDARMLEQYGELATPDAIERAADKAIHNDARGRFIATEANALAKATGQRKVLASAARDFARQMVARLKVRDIRPGQYAAAEVRAGKAAQKASEAGDLATAAAEKRNQLVNTYATRAAYDAQDEVDAGVRYLRKFDSDSVRKGLDVDYTDQIDALLERFDLRKGTSLKAIDKRKSLVAWVESQREQGLEPDIPEEMLDEARRQSYKELTVEEFRGLVDSVKQIEHLGRLKHKLLTAKDQKAYEAVRDEIVASIGANSNGRTADTRTPTTNMGRALQSLKQFYTSHLKAATLARVMDGGKDGGPMWEYFVRSANERGDMETTMRAEATRALSEIMAPVFKLGRMGGKGQFFPAINRSLNRESRIAIALNTGNEGNLQRLLGGEGWTLDQIQPVLQSLTATEWRAVQAVWDHFESYRPQIAAKERRIYGKEPAWVEPTPLTVSTADGEQISLRGGYYPIKYDPAASQRAEEHADAEGAKRQLQGAYTSATTRRSFTKTRAEEVSGRPLLYTLAGMYSGVNDVIHDLAWHEWLVDVNRLMRSKTIDSAIRNTYGPEVKGQFKTWIADIAEGDKGPANAGEMALSKLRQSVSVAGLGFNVMSAAMQPLGLTQSIVRVGPTWVGKGIAQYLAGPIAAARSVNARSDFMANRSRTRFRELNELRNRVQDQSAFDEFLQAGAFFMMMRMQQMVDVPTWLGAYDKAIAEGNAEERAIALADQAVIDAQGGGQTKDLSAIERGGPALKLFTVFYSFFNTAMNLGVMRTMTERSKARLAVDYLMLYTVPAVLGFALKQALTPGDDDLDDPEKLAKQLLAAQIDYLMGLMVVVREFNEAAKTIAGANDKGRDYTGPAGLRLVTDTITFAKQAHQGEFDDAFRKASVNLVGDLFGLPSAQINRSITGAQAFAEGETNNPAAIVFGFQKQ